MSGQIWKSKLKRILFHFRGVLNNHWLVSSCQIYQCTLPLCKLVRNILVTRQEFNEVAATSKSPCFKLNSSFPTFKVTMVHSPVCVEHKLAPEGAGDGGACALCPVCVFSWRQFLFVHLGKCCVSTSNAWRAYLILSFRVFFPSSVKSKTRTRFMSVVCAVCPFAPTPFLVRKMQEATRRNERIEEFISVLPTQRGVCACQDKSLKTLENILQPVYKCFVGWVLHW